MKALPVACVLLIAGWVSCPPARSDEPALAFWSVARPAAWTWRVTNTAGRGASPVVQGQLQRDESRPAVFQPRWVQFRDGRWWQEVSPGVYQRTIPYSAPAPIYSDESCGPGG